MVDIAAKPGKIRCRLVQRQAGQRGWSTKVPKYRVDPRLDAAMRIMHHMRRPASFQLTGLVPSACVAANDSRLVLRRILKQVGMHRLQMRCVKAAG
jgi:hypothetical protein